MLLNPGGNLVELLDPSNPVNQVVNTFDDAETDKDYVVKIDMPGMNKDDIKLNYKDGVLSVAGTRQAFKDTSDKNRNIIHQERSEGSISRSYRLPNVVASDIHAKYDNGVLTITLPKQTASDDGNSIQID